MLLEESKWIGKVLNDLNLKQGQTVLDIGSCSEEYRCLEQPYIDYYIFKPLRSRGLSITHVDGQKEKGVDLVCDMSLGEPKNVFDQIQPADVVIAANLLEHVQDREKTITNICSKVKPGGVLILTVPHVFPYHPHPIDTMYRPTPKELIENIKTQNSELELLAINLVEIKHSVTRAGFFMKAFDRATRYINKTSKWSKEVQVSIKISCVAVKIF